MLYDENQQVDVKNSLAHHYTKKIVVKNADDIRRSFNNIRKSDDTMANSLNQAKKNILESEIFQNYNGIDLKTSEKNINASNIQILDSTAPDNKNALSFGPARNKLDTTITSAYKSQFEEIQSIIRTNEDYKVTEECEPPKEDFKKMPNLYRNKYISSLSTDKDHVNQYLRSSIGTDYSSASPIKISPTKKPKDKIEKNITNLTNYKKPLNNHKQFYDHGYIRSSSLDIDNLKQYNTKVLDLSATYSSNNKSVLDPKKPLVAKFGNMSFKLGDVKYHKDTKKIEEKI